MVQKPAQFCTNCGTPYQAGQRFCPNCGATLDINVAGPTMASKHTPAAPAPASATWSTVDTSAPTQTAPASSSDPVGTEPMTPGSLPGGTPPVVENHQPAQLIAPPPPPPPAFNPYTGSSSGAAFHPEYPSFQPNAPTAPPAYTPTAASPSTIPAYSQAQRPIVSTPQAVPVYAQKPKNNHGCLISSLVLLLILALGIGSFLIYKNHTSQGNPGLTPTAVSGNQPTANATSQSTSTPTAAVSQVEQLNLAFTYASVSITIASVQEATSFSNDTNTSGQNGVVRINMQENNTTTGNPNYLESEVFLLVLPDQSTVQSGNQEQVISPAAQVNRKNWVDFPLDQAVPLNKLTLRVGRPSEHQMNIPLYPGASLTTYQDKVTSPNKTFQYASLAWTLKTATLSYSFADTQAPTNQLYTVVTLAATNSTSTNFENEPINYIRLQTQGNSIQPDDNSNFPLSIPAQANGSGTLAFLVPQDATSFTLVFLAQADANISQASVTFQIG